MLNNAVEGMTDSDRRIALLDWLAADLPNFFTGRILPVDTHVADRWGRMVAVAGMPLPVIGSRLGTTAIHLVGKIFTQRIERHNLNLRTHIKRLTRKTICFSRSIELHEKVIDSYTKRMRFN